MSHRILVTGSSGYIGSHMVKFFHQKGATVFGIDLVFPPKNLQKYFSNHIVEDISNKNVVPEFLSKHKPDLVIHCAAKCLVAESVEKPDLYYDYNVKRAQDFLNTCVEANVLNFLFSSTAATYGEPLQNPIPESHAQKPINPYGQTKLEFEKILLSQKNICSGIVRYFNAAGADPDVEIGEHHEPETHLIPNVIQSILTNKQVSIFGDDYPTPDQTCIRDYIHVMDLAEFHWMLADRMLNQKQGGIYNLGSNHGFSILEVLDAAEKITGKKSIKNFLPRRPGDPSVLIADSTHAKKDFGWNPKLSDLESIIKTALAWHQNQ